MNCDRLAPFYRMLEAIAAGGKLQRCRLAFLDEIPAPRRVLLAGEGHGRFLPECVRRFPEAEIVVVDSSAKMLEIAKRKAAGGRVEFVHANLQEWKSGNDRFDLIVTHFFLDCFSTDGMGEVVNNLGTMATADAQWLLADFQIANDRLSGLRSRFIIRILYVFFRIFCKLETSSLASPDSHLINAGFSLHRRLDYDWDLLKSEWWRRN